MCLSRISWNSSRSHSRSFTVCVCTFCKFVRVLNAIFHRLNRMRFSQPQISRLETFRVNGKVPCNIHKSILTNQSVWPCLQLIHSSWCLLVTVVAFIIRVYIFREHTHMQKERKREREMHTYTHIARLKEKSNSFRFTTPPFTRLGDALNRHQLFLVWTIPNGMAYYWNGLRRRQCSWNK